VTESPESFLERWSRRKRGAGDADEPRGVVAGPEAVGPEGAETDRPSLTDADMPPIESLGDDDDYSGFLGESVSEALRQAALRRLFRSAKFNVTDGLDDYAEDFTTFAPLGNVVTADMKHRARQLLDRLAGGAEEDVAGLEAGVAESDPVAEGQAGEADAVEGDLRPTKELADP
jgi:hypothetical protein